MFQSRQLSPAAVALAIALTILVFPRVSRAGDTAGLDHPIAGRLAWVGLDSNIYSCDGKCAKPDCITCPVEGLEARRENGFVPVVLRVAREAPADYGWPTFSPDGARLAFISSGRSEGGRRAFAVRVYDFAKRDSTTIFQSAVEQPIYLFWLPDSQNISFLVTGRDGLSLMLSRAHEGAAARVVVSGMPLYYDWNAARHKLAAHTNSPNGERTEQTLLLSYSDSSQEIERVLTRGYAPFKAPAWSPNGARFAYIATVKGKDDEEKANLMVADANAEHPRAVASLPDGENSFAWAPDSRHIAYATGELNNNGFVFRGIHLLDVSDGSTKKISEAEVTAYYFSPDSHHLAVVGAPPSRPYYTWEIIDLPSGQTRRVATFLATPEDTTAFRYFEQLTLSHNLWSPDSSAIVFGGVMLRGAPREATGPTPPPRIWIIPADKSAPREVAEGVLAYWSPAH